MIKNFFSKKNFFQSFNILAVFTYVYVIFFKKNWAIPHDFVKNINHLSPENLKQHGFKGVIFDKDNTLTNPYDHKIHPLIKKTFLRFKKVFGNNLVIMSNYSGTNDDLDCKDAKIIENRLGVKVLRHKRKKPHGIEAVQKYFEDKADLSEIVVIGDRVFTDIVFGNKNGMFTILTEAFGKKNDNYFASLIRSYELKLNELTPQQADGVSVEDPRLCRQTRLVVNDILFYNLFLGF